MHPLLTQHEEPRPRWRCYLRALAIIGGVPALIVVVLLAIVAAFSNFYQVGQRDSAAVQAANRATHSHFSITAGTTGSPATVATKVTWGNRCAIGAVVVRDGRLTIVYYGPGVHNDGSVRFGPYSLATGAC